MPSALTVPAEPLPEEQTSLQAVFLVEELAARWKTHPETVRMLIRERKLKPLRGLRPYRITFAEVRRYESLDDFTEKREAFLAQRAARK